MSPTVFGTALGLALGFALAFGGFGRMVVVGVLAAIGFGVAKVLSGEVDVGGYLANRRGPR